MKKRFLGLALSAAMVASLAGCGLKSPETTTTAAATEAAATEAATTAAAETTAEAAKDSTATAEVPDASGDPEVTLVYAEVNPLDTIVGQTDTALKV